MRMPHGTRGTRISPVIVAGRGGGGEVAPGRGSRRYAGGAQVTAERLAVVELDVERGEVEERQVEVLGGGVVGIGDQAARIDPLGDVHQFGEEPLHALGPVPADDVGADLVADAVGHDAGVVPAEFGSLADLEP